MGDEVGGKQPLIDHRRSRPLSRSISYAQDELHTFRWWLKLMCVDQSNLLRTCLSWLVFVVFAIVVPCLSHFFLACADCDSKHARPFDSVVQLSLSGVAAISFLCLTRFIKKYGLRRFLFLDKLCDESETVRGCYMEQLYRSLKILFYFVMPCFAVQTAYKIWWYGSGGTQIPFLGNIYVSDTVACVFELCSWLYRTMVFFLVCVLFRLICCLQILRLQDFGKVFQSESDVESVLREHLRIRRHLRIISHRYRAFILGALFFITASQLASLLMVMKAHSSSQVNINMYFTGELALCSISLVAGLMILLRSATRITHKAQSVTSLVTKWHVCATIDSFETNEEAGTPVAPVTTNQIFPDSTDGSSDGDDAGDEEDELDNTKLVPAFAYSTISFQKRQALVTYFENNRAGITVYGFMLDRGSLHTIFGIEMSLVLWLLGKTIANL